MTSDSRKANIQAEVEKADTSLRAARALFDLALYDECVSRAYYTVFHLLNALLLTEGLESKSHRGVDHLVNMHFVRRGALEAQHAKAFARLMQFRLQADYSRAFRFTQEGAAEELALAETTSTALLERLRAGGWLSPS